MSGSSSSSSNANAKKKQEEKHLKMLRELLAVASNKNCFDCNQRGPTYANTTIGSFICISCSGKLRGLTPPHRVKSISMASFTTDEIDYLRSRGNEFCRQTWMALFNGDVSAETKDDQRFRDHLTAKYEKKRWYAEPNSCAARSLQTPTAAPAPSGLAAAPVESGAVAGAAQSSPKAAKSADLLADFDFFGGAAAALPSLLSSSSSTAFPSAATHRHPSMPQSVSQPSFANFQDADFFVANFPAVVPAAQEQQQQQQQQPQQQQQQQTPDRYSALKDLDALFTSASAEPTPAVNWSAPTPAVPSSSLFGAPSHAEAQLAAATPPAPAHLWSAAPSASGSHSNNPFLASAASTMHQQQQQHQQQHQQQQQQQHQQQQQQVLLQQRPALPWANFAASPLTGGGGGGGGGVGPFGDMVLAPLTTSQSLNLSPKAWNVAGTAGHNPFMQESACFAKGGPGRSHNPFL